MITRKIIRAVKIARKTINYFRIHLLYILLLVLLGSLVIWRLEKENSGINYVDSFFMCTTPHKFSYPSATSATTVTGLNTVDLSEFRVATQLFILIQFTIGNNIWISVAPILVRKFYIRSHFQNSIGRSGITTENQSLSLMIILVPLFSFVNILSIFIALGLYLQVSPSPNTIVVRNRVNPWWWAFFHSMSAFANAGFALFSDNLVQYQTDVTILLCLAWLILIGNTAFPLILRLLIWTCLKLSKSKVLEFILIHPRRVYIYLFPSKETRLLLILFWVILLSTWIWMLVFDWNRLDYFSSGQKILVYFFQTICTRVAGFNVIDISVLHKSTLVMFLGSMYISVYPIVVSLRSSNIFLKKIPPKREIEHELQRLFAKDTAWIFFSFLLISATETGSLDDPRGTGDLPDPRFNMFAVFFEIMSAYGNVGLSLGYPGTVTSFSAKWRPFSKVVLCGVMYLGRHRGLPDSVDRALRLEVGQPVLNE